jgi:signal peptidase II
MTARASRWLLVGLMLCVTGCDQATKAVAESQLQGEPPAVIVRDRLDLTYARNPGVAFNLERVLPPRAHRPAAILAALLILPLLFVALVRSWRAPTWTTTAYAMILAGAAGNFLDRLTRGEVIDFIHLHGWPVFNVADLFVTGGVLLLLAQQLAAARLSPRRR